MCRIAAIGRVYRYAFQGAGANLYQGSHRGSNFVDQAQQIALVKELRVHSHLAGHDVKASGAGTTVVQVTTPETAVDGPVQIDVVVGVDSGEDRVVKVKVSADITLNITNPDAADEFHVHGVELEQSVDAGVMATFNFTLDEAGTYEVESHVTDDVLLIIEVS